MPNGYRCLVIALFGLIGLAANHSNAEGADKQSAAQSSIAASLQNITASDDQAPKRTEGTEEEAKCGERKYASSADLCAQWKAADSASDSAWWAWASGIAGIGSLFGVFFAVGLALQSNRIAQRAANQQLRAYLGCPAVWIDGAKEGRFRVENYGQTPAFDVTATCIIFSDADEHRIGIVDPQASGVHRFGMPQVAWPTIMDDGWKITSPLSLSIIIRYRDTNGRWWERGQSFEIGKGEPVKFADGKHIADFSRSHGTSYEKAIKPQKQE